MRVNRIGRRGRRRGIVASLHRIVPMACAVACIVGTPAEAARALRFDIEPQSLAAALDQFAREAGVQILYPYAIATTHRVAGMHGTMQPRAALQRLLQGSGLAIASFDDRTIALRIAAPAPQRRRRVRRPEARLVSPPPAS